MHARFAAPRRMHGALLLGAALLVMAPQAGAVTIYDEAIHGDLANNTGEGSPTTPIGALVLGDNEVIGTMGDDGSNNDDTDLFTFNVPFGMEIVSIALTYSVASGDPGGGSYFGIQAGTSIATTLANIGDNLSNALVGASGDLLAIWEAGPAFGGSGLTGPLGAGDYSIFVSETAAEIDYVLGLGVAAVPEPGAAVLLGTAVLLAAARRRT